MTMDQRVASGFEAVGTKMGEVVSELSTFVKSVNSVTPNSSGNVNITMVSGNAGSATKLQTARTISLTGDVSGSVSFDGQKDVSITATVADDSHAHVISNVDGLQTALDAKAALASPTLTGTPKAPTATAGTNTTQIATTAFVTTALANKTSVASATKATQDASGNVITSTYATKTELTNGLAGKAASSHTHAISDVTNLQTALDSKLSTTGKAASATVADSANAVAWSNVSGKPDAFTPAGHNQASNTINALTGYAKASSASALTTSDTLNTALGKLEKALDGKLSTSGTAAKATADASGNTITSTYATKSALTDGLAGKANSSHSHTIGDVTELQTALDGKLNSGANAVSASKWATARTITLDGDASGSVSIDGSANKTLTVTVKDDSHNHVISNVDGLQTALDGKAAKENSVFFIDGTGTTEGSWLGTHTEIKEYYQGLTIAYKVGIAGVSGGSTLNINNLGAAAVVRNNGSAITTHYGVGSILVLTYDVGSDTGTAYWKLADYDSDTKTRSSNKTGSKMYIIGATSQSTSGQTTYSNSNCYIGTDNKLYSGGKVVANTTDVDTALSTAKSYTDTAVANLVNSAPTTLDTLGELATALQNNVGVTDALNTAIGTKANDSEVVKLTGNQTIAGTKTFSSTISGSISGNAATATKATQDGSGNVITSTYLTKTDASNTYLGKSAKASSATSADSATKATQDASGNVITSTYATKTELTNGLAGKSDTSHTHTNESLGSGYATNADYASTLEKKVSLSNFKLVKGGFVVIKFSGNVLANSTLNINSTGAKSIFYKGKAIVEGVICAGEIATFMYDGTQYNLLAVDRNRFYSSLVPYGTQIVPSETNLLDLNSVEYLKVGNYFCSNTASTEYLANKPEKTAFMMQVSSPLSQTVDDEMSGAWKYRLRRFIGYQGSEYLSYCSVGSTAGEWSYGPWYKVITTKDTATQSKAGLMSAADKKKLDGIADGATGYTHPDTHPASMITGLATVATSGKYSDLSGTPSSLPANGGNAATVGGFTVGVNVPSNAKFTDTVYTLPNATSSVLGGVKVGSNISVSSGTISLTKDNVTAALGYTPPTTDTKYTHPSYTAKSSGFYKVTVDATGHVSATTAVTKADITGLGIPAQDTVYTLPNATSSVLGGVKIGSNITVSSGTISLSKSNVTSALGYTPPTQDTTYSAASQSAAGLMSADDKKKLDGIATGANNYTYTLPTASSSTLGGVKTTSTVTSTSGLTACPIISGVPYYKDTNNTYTLSSFSVTATATELNVLDGITATTAELNYCDGVTSNIQTQLNGKLSTSGTAAKATADASGNTITSTYATKTELNGKANSATTLSGYGITDAYTKSQTQNNFLQGISTETNYDINKAFDGKMYMVKNGASCPSGSQYGVVLGMPYRQMAGNSKTDFGAQIFLPNGDDSTHPNSMFYRTSLGDAWNAWQEVATTSYVSSNYLGKTAKAASATSADSATKATQDGSGNTITSTYLTKTDAANTYLGKSATAAKATADASGNTITSTYATKTEVTSAVSGVVKSVNGTAPDENGNVNALASYFSTDGVKSGVVTDNRYIAAPSGGQWFCFGLATKTYDGNDGDSSTYSYYITPGLYAGGTRLVSTADKYGSMNNAVICLRVS